MSKAQWRQTGAGPHEDRRTHRNRDRQAQQRHAIEEQTCIGPINDAVHGNPDCTGYGKGFDQHHCSHGVQLDETCSECDDEEDASRRMVSKYAIDLDDEAELSDMLGLWASRNITL